MEAIVYSRGFKCDSFHFLQKKLCKFHDIRIFVCFSIGVNIFVKNYTGSPSQMSDKDFVFFNAQSANKVMRELRTKKCGRKPTGFAQKRVSTRRTVGYHVDVGITGNILLFYVTSDTEDVRLQQKTVSETPILMLEGHTQV